MSTFALISLFTAIGCAFLGGFVYHKDPKNPLNRIYMVFCLFSAYLSFTEFGLRQTGSAADAFIWMKLTHLWPFVSVMQLHFVLVFSEKTRRFKTHLVYLVLYTPAVAFSLLFLFTDLLSPAPVKENWGWNFNTNKNAVVFSAMAWNMLIYIIGIYLAFRYYLRTNLPLKKQQAKYIAIGLLVPILVGLLSRSLMTTFNFKITAFTSLPILVANIFIGWAIWKYRLFNISPALAAENIISTMSDALFLVNPEGKIQKINDAARQLLGYKEADLIGRTFTDIIAEEHRAEVTNRLILDELPQTGLVKNIEVNLISASGVLLPLSLSISLARDRDSGQAGTIYVGRDLTEHKKIEEYLRQTSAELSKEVTRRTGEIQATNQALQQQISERWRAEAQLRESENKFKDLVEKSLTGVYLVQDGVFQYVNPYFARMFGYTVEEIAGITTPQELVAPEDWPMVQENIRKRLSGEVESIHHTFRGVKKNKEIVYIEAFGTYTVYQEKPAIIGTTLDITEHRRLEEQLLQAQKMEAIGRLAGGIAHDFNNMLAVITGYISLILSTIEENNPIRNDLLEIKKASERAAELTHQLLAFSRRQILQPQILNLNDLLAEMEKMLKRVIGENIHLQTVPDPQLLNVKIDPGQVQQVLMNLIINARDAMPSGGRIIITTENITLTKEESRRIPESRPGQFACLSVQDTGTAMSPETLEHAFEPFYTTKEPGKGTGLGLSTAYGIVKQHNGWINVSSAVGEGSTFKIYLPVAPAEIAAPLEKPSLPLDKIRGRGERILVVEDEIGVRRLVSQALAKHGYRVFEAGKVKEALDIFAREKGNFQLVFTDIILPDENGFQLMEKLLPVKPDLRIIFTSGYTEEKAQLNLVREKGFPFLQKPYAMADLLSTVKQEISRP